MKIQTNQYNIEHSSSFQSQEFKISNSAAAFSVLSNNLYQDKILAVIREISTNALDAHILMENGIKNDDGSWMIEPQANYTKKPFHVHFPTSLNPFFTVRDYGPGLSDEQMYNNYTTYFGSTKSNDNDMIGGFGLGSKAPFAVSTTFTIVSRYQGTKTIWTAMIGSNGTPDIIKMHEEPCSEQSGLEVSVPVNDCDIERYKAIGNYIYDFFPVAPENNLDGLDKTLVEEGALEPTYILGYNSPIEHAFTIKFNGHPNLPSLVYGMIRYNVDYNALSKVLDQQEIEMVKYYLSNHQVIIAPFGCLDISPSREVLSYTDRTLEFFKNFCMKTMQQFTDVFNSEIAKCTSRRDMLEVIRKITGGSIINEQSGNLVKPIIDFWGYNYIKSQLEAGQITNKDGLTLTINDLHEKRRCLINVMDEFNRGVIGCVHHGIAFNIKDGKYAYTGRIGKRINYAAISRGSEIKSAAKYRDFRAFFNQIKRDIDEKDFVSVDVIDYNVIHQIQKITYIHVPFKRYPVHSLETIMSQIAAKEVMANLIDKDAPTPQRYMHFFVITTHPNEQIAITRDYFGIDVELVTLAELSKKHKIELKAVDRVSKPKIKKQKNIISGHILGVQKLLKRPDDMTFSATMHMPIKDIDLSALPHKKTILIPKVNNKAFLDKSEFSAAAISFITTHLGNPSVNYILASSKSIEQAVKQDKTIQIAESVIDCIDRAHWDLLAKAFIFKKYFNDIREVFDERKIDEIILLYKLVKMHAKTKYEDPDIESFVRLCEKQMNHMSGLKIGNTYKIVILSDMFKHSIVDQIIEKQGSNKFNEKIIEAFKISIHELLNDYKTVLDKHPLLDMVHRQICNDYNFTRGYWNETARVDPLFKSFKCKWYSGKKGVDFHNQMMENVKTFINTL